MTQNATTYLIVACEESGDKYGAGIAREILKSNPSAKLIGVGGKQMQAAGVDVRINLVDHAVMGAIEVLSSIRFFLNAMNEVVEMAKNEHADVAVLIDSPDFNLRIAPKLKKAGTKISYFISPQMWVWRSGRIETVKRYVDEMLCILPFEEEWYRERGAEATYVGHPLMDLLDFEAIKHDAQNLRQASLDGKEGPLIGILPGSRGMEVKRLLPRFLQAGREIKAEFPHARFVIGCSEWLNEDRSKDLSAAYADIGIRLERDNTYGVMAASDMLLCCSGTATLEAALIGTPMVMAYHVKWLSYLIASTFYFNASTLFSLPNIILGERVVPEQIQFQAAPTTIAIAAMDVLRADRGAAQREAFETLRKKVGGPGAIANASARILAMAGDA